MNGRYRLEFEVQVFFKFTSISSTYNDPFFSHLCTKRKLIKFKIDSTQRAQTPAKAEHFCPVCSMNFIEC